MLTTKRKPAAVGEILVEEFLRPMGLTQGALAAAMGVPAQARQRALQRPPRRDGGDGADPRARVREEPRLLPQHSAAERSLGSHEQPRQRERIKRAQDRLAPRRDAGLVLRLISWVRPSLPLG